MINKKKVLGFVAALALIGGAGAGLASCGGGSGPADLTYWCTTYDNDVMDQIVAEFKKAYPDLPYDQFIKTSKVAGSLKIAI